MKIDFKLQRRSTRVFVFAALVTVLVSELTLPFILWTLTNNVMLSVLLAIPVGGGFVGFILIILKAFGFLVSWSDRGR